MTHMGVDYASLLAGAERWQHLVDLLDETARDLGSAPVGGLAPSCQGAARAFLTAWEGYAGESSAIVAGFAAALDGVVADTRTADAEVHEAMAALDSRLGPAR